MRPVDCPVCLEAWGFHNDRIHARVVIPPDKLLAKGWLEEARKREQATNVA